MDSEWEQRAEKALKMTSQPFLDDNIMDHECPPSCAKSDLKRPRLRKFPFDVDSISFVGGIYPYRGRNVCTGQGLDGGLDGYNWKIRVRNAGPTHVLKLVSAGMPCYGDRPAVLTTDIWTLLHVALGYGALVSALFCPSERMSKCCSSPGHGSGSGGRSPA